MNIQQVMKQAKELQDKMTRIQQEVEHAEYTGQSGGGIVKVGIQGNGTMTSCEFAADALSQNDAETLGDLVVAAFKQAKSQADTALTDKLSSAGISPEMMKFGM